MSNRRRQHPAPNTPSAVSPWLIAALAAVLILVIKFLE